MSGILEKLGSYQILTNLLPGAFFGFGINFLLELKLPTKDIGEDVVVYYFMGLIINRLGSLVVEPSLKKIGFIKYTPYIDFVKSAKVDSMIVTLSEMNNYTRSLLTCVLLLPVIRILRILFLNWTWFSLNWKWGAIALLVVLFLFAYRKQSSYICTRVDAVNNHELKEKKMEAERQKVISG